MKDILKGADSFDNWHKQRMKSAKYRKAFNDLDLEYTLIEAIIRCRLAKNLTQSQLAKKIGTKQPVISRLEGGSFNPSVKFLKRVATALDAELEISLRP
jgi:ribosome-binding protein aMBF1 (putative translation factor)